MTLKQAIIRPEDCIGCTKCLDVCPTDAIIGASQLLHSVITEDCIGCERCVPACPVDCIDLMPMPDEYNPEKLDATAKSKRSEHIRSISQQRKERLARLEAQEREAFFASKAESSERKGYLEGLLKKEKL
jgi:electron transport complex protein RnfB